MESTEIFSMDSAVVAVQGLVNLFLHMDAKGREMFIKLLVVKIEEEEVDLLLEVVDMRNSSNHDNDVLNVKKDVIKIEMEDSNDGLNYAQNDQNMEDEKTDVGIDSNQDHNSNYETETTKDQITEDGKSHVKIEGSQVAIKDEMSIDIPFMYEPNGFNLNNGQVTPLFKCSYCDQSFENRKELKKHGTTHPEYYEEKERKTFLCDLCPKSFNLSSTLKRHKNIHDEIKLKMFICEICSNSFSTNEYLKIHIHRQHNLNKDLNCDQCSYKTAHVTSLKIHKRSHTGERPFVCHICSKTFTQSQHMNRHIKAVHMGEKTKNYTQNTGEKNYLCDLCPMTCSTSSSLMKHKQSFHEGIRYFCDECGHKAYDKSGLARHVASIHRGIRHQCEECDHKASSKHSLNVHYQTVHLGNKMSVSCDQCDKQYTDPGALSRHKKVVHKGIRYPCDQCDHLATQKQYLREHKLSKHKI